MSFYLYFILIILLERIKLFGSINVGTVLFTESDLNKECWSCENIALLTSRMLMEDILPAEEALVIRDDDFISNIVEYFHLVLEVVRKVTYGKAKHVMLLSMTDVLGKIICLHLCL